MHMAVRVIRVIVVMAVLTLAMRMRMPVTAVGTALWFKGFMHGDHRHVHGTQHVGQHMVGLYLQMVGLQFNGHMAVAQVIGRTRQVK